MSDEKNKMNSENVRKVASFLQAPENQGKLAKALEQLMDDAIAQAISFYDLPRKEIEIAVFEEEGKSLAKFIETSYSDHGDTLQQIRSILNK